MEQAQIQIQVNGESLTYVGVDTVAQLLTHLGRDNVPCAVEVNQQLVPRPSILNISCMVATVLNWSLL